MFAPRVRPVAALGAALVVTRPSLVVVPHVSPPTSPSASPRRRQRRFSPLNASERSRQPRATVAFDRFDYYVVHSWTDDPALKARALEQWAARYALAHDGRKPRLWLDALCADASRTELEQLADLPFVMCRARGLLLLCGPKTLDKLRCAIELYVWLATGGTVDDVQLVLVGPSSVCAQVVASFDVFHVMYASAAAGDVSDPAVVERLVRVVELARVSVFNELIRSFMPVVREQFALARARADEQTPPVADASLLSRINSESVLVQTPGRGGLTRILASLTSRNASGAYCGPSSAPLGSSALDSRARFSQSQSQREARPAEIPRPPSRLASGKFLSGTLRASPGSVAQ
jgi:hypothetical protein